MTTKTQEQTTDLMQDISNFKENFLKEFQNRKPIKKTKPKKVNISTKKDGESFSITPKDTEYFLNESLAELQYQTKDSEYYREQREILFETYFTFKFLAREYHWSIPREIEMNRPIIDDYYKEYIRENYGNMPPSLSFGLED